MGTTGAQGKRIVIVGAGMVGLATAWFLQEQGTAVTVVERNEVAAGASWGNAGWLTPSLTVPLPEPAVLRFGLRAMLKPDSPLYLPLRPDPQLWRFLLGFARHSTRARWVAGIKAYAPMSRRALDAYDRLTAGGVAEPVYKAEPFLACFRSAAGSEGLLEELDHLQKSGLTAEYEVFEGDEIRRLEPALTDEVRVAVRLMGQRFINPVRYMEALAHSVRERGGVIQEGTAVREVRDDGSKALVVLEDGHTLEGDAVVVASGAELPRLARRFGVRAVIQAGRGYSFSIPMERIPAGPVYFPVQRVACTPLGERLRVAGMMEFRAPDDPLDPRRIDAIVKAAKPLFRGADFSARQDEWVGSRPCTADGLPLIGPTSSPRVFVGGGHCMWGIFLGPLTGQLLAEIVMTGQTPAELAPFNPLR